jgi:tRNA pseudouridine55 synthase
MINGIILIDKEKNITSYDVIRKLKRLLPRKYKIGHAGTLDPFATGLLVILLGKGTKLMDTFHTLRKRYEVTAEFGYSTDTQDIDGEKIEKIDATTPIPQEVIEEKIQEKFLGSISQLPPVYSAKKVNGKKAYELAREGKEVELKPKQIQVSEFQILEYDWPIVKFSVQCSTGTYVRTLVNDLGKELGSLATAIELRRTQIGDFKVEDSFKSSNIDEHFDLYSNHIVLDKVNEILQNE